MEDYIKYLHSEEKSRKTIEKYRRDLKCFFDFIGEKNIDRENILAYKKYLSEKYSPVSGNSMLCVLNSYLKFTGQEKMRVKQFKLQRRTYCPVDKELTKEEYKRLVSAADEKMSLIIQAICGMGIRVSELKYLTSDAVEKGVFTVSCKNKVRQVFIVKELRKKLKQYIKKNKISGIVFATRNGTPLDRSNIWRAMKRLCQKARVPAAKVFPHNLRHLFARIFYAGEKDIVKLADILGHSNIETTRIYIMSDGSEYARQMERMRLII